MKHLLAGLSLFAIVGAAMAMPVVNGQPSGAPAPYPAAPSDLVDRSIPNVIQHGDPVPSVAGVAAGRSSGTPLGSALEILLPKGWRGSISPEVDAEVVASWEEGRTWLQALSDVASSASLQVTVIWPRRFVLIDPRSPAAAEVSAEWSLQGQLQNGSWGVATAQTPSQVPVVQKIEHGAGPAREYPGLRDFLHDTISIDQSAMPLGHAIAATLPQGWHVDFRLDDLTRVETLVDITYIGPRGDLLHQIGRQSGLSMLPYFEFHKIIVSASGTR